MMGNTSIRNYIFGKVIFDREAEPWQHSTPHCLNRGRHRYGETVIHWNALVDARFKNWPEDPFVRASYAFPAKGDITRWGPIFDRGVGNLHFAGEHTCYAFIGYMEGALQSGIRVANRLMVRDKLANPIP